MVIGWQFMWQVFKLLFDNMREKVECWFKGAISTFAETIARVSSELRERAECSISCASSLLPPLYSLVDVREGYHLLQFDLLETGYRLLGYSCSRRLSELSEYRKRSFVR